ncbi:hypothetical protein KKF84_20085 [Myxococcota bacterium]|nr:hypothetical protein [Myxococcota bacterium]MBU1537625.1 hypothetical protein [Myxococcota bacterium]
MIMQICIIGNLAKSMELARKLELRFEAVEIVVVASLKESRGADMLLTEFSGDDVDVGDFSFSFQAVEEAYRGKVFELWEQYEDLESDVGRKLREMLANAENEGSEHSDDSDGKSLSDLVDSDMFSVVGKEEFSSDEYDPLPDEMTKGGSVVDSIPPPPGDYASYDSNSVEFRAIDELKTVYSEPEGKSDPPIPDLGSADIRDAFLMDSYDDGEEEEGGGEDNLISRIFDDEDSLSPDESTPPAILKKDNRDVSISHPAPEVDSRDIEERKVLDVAKTLLDLISDEFSGIMEATIAGNHVVFTWHGGQIGDVEGYGPFLATLLTFSGTDKNLVADMNRRGKDPMAFALKRRIIKPQEQIQWLVRCREEAFGALFQEGSVFRLDESASFSQNLTLPLHDPRHLILRGVVEHYGTDLAYARSGGVQPERTNQNLMAEFIRWESVDPLWIRAVSLFSSGAVWPEAVIRSGLTEEEGINLGYGLRLLGVFQPVIESTITLLEIERERIVSLWEKSMKMVPSMLGGTGAAARRHSERVAMMIAAMDPVLRRYMDEKISQVNDRIHGEELL